MKPPRVGSTEFKAKKYWLASSYRTKDRLRTAERRYADYSINDLKALRQDKQKEATCLTEFLNNFTSWEDHERVYYEARSLYREAGTLPNFYVKVENRRCLDFSKNKNSVTSGSLKDMAIEGHSAVLTLQGSVHFHVLGTCLKIYDDGNYLEFQPFNTNSQNAAFQHMRGILNWNFFRRRRLFRLVSGGRELTDDEKLERFKTRVLHVSEVNKYHQIYDRGIALGPSRIQGLVELTTQVVQDLEVVIYRRKNPE